MTDHVEPSAAEATEERNAWDTHWASLSRGSSVFGWMVSLVRRWLLRPCVAAFARRHFEPEGVLIEAGCGTSEASLAIPRLPGRTLVGLDFSLTALVLAKHKGLFDGVVCGDIRHMPFAEGTATGLWNLGVMEHFEQPIAHAILREMSRVLKLSGGRIVLFWPPTFGLSRWVLAPFEWTRSVLSGRRFRFYPDEVFRLRSAAQGRDVLAAAGIETCEASFGPRDGFNHLILVGRRRSDET